MKKIKSRKWQSGKTGAVLVLSVCSMLLILNGIRKNAAQLQYQLQQYLLRSAQAMYVPSLVWKEDSVSSGPGEWIRQKALAWIPVVQYVEDHGVQTRMLFAGNLIKHPCFDEMRSTGEGYRVVGELKNTDRIMNDTFWVGVYPGMTDEMIDYMAQTIKEAVNQ